MKIRLIAVALAAVLVTAGVMAFSHQPSNTPGDAVAASTESAAASSQPDANERAYLDDFKAGYADGFASGVAHFTYPDQSTMASSARGYLDGFSQGYGDGQEQEAVLRSELCPSARVSEVTGSAPGYAPRSYAAQPFAASNRATATARRVPPAVNDAYVARERPVNRGISTNTRRALLIGGGAAAGAGLGGAIGGKKGALIGALAGGGTGTALAYSKQPSRAFNRRVSGKQTIVNTLLGAGAGAGIGALAGGKRGALAGAGIGGGGAALYTLMSGQRARR